MKLENTGLKTIPDWKPETTGLLSTWNENAHV
jgi:hypothetical protein